LKLCVHPSDLAPGLMLGHDVELGEDLAQVAVVPADSDRHS